LIQASLSHGAHGAAMCSIIRRLGSVNCDNAFGPSCQMRCIIVGTMVTQLTL
jgi:hypothetical protein